MRDYSKTLHSFDFIFMKVTLEFDVIYDAIPTVMMSKF